jgi:hypothetical protein
MIESIVLKRKRNKININTITIGFQEDTEVHGEVLITEFIEKEVEIM